MGPTRQRADGGPTFSQSPRHLPPKDASLTPRQLRCVHVDFEVELVDDNINDMHVTFHGPKESAYEGGVWRVHVELPESYPYKSPSIGFVNKIFHPNVCEQSGSICLDVINQTWSPMFDLVNIFTVFLPQLLLYPNASDPLNGEAAALSMRDPAAYAERVKVR